MSTGKNFILNTNNSRVLDRKKEMRIRIKIETKNTNPEK